MSNLEKVSYIRGLAEGLELDGSKKEVKVLNAVIDQLLTEQARRLDDEDDDDEEECYYEVTCPNCNETICLSEDIICDGQIECPNCGKLLEFDLDDDECDCGCGCEDCQDKD